MEIGTKMKNARLSAQLTQEQAAEELGSKKKLAQLIIVIIYLVIWVFSLIAFWFFTSPSDAMGYSLMFLWILLPVTTFVLSLLIGKNDYWGRWKWIFAIFFGIMYMLAEYGTFSLANMIAFHRTNLPSFGMILNGAIVSLVGLGIGIIIYRRKENDIESGT